MNARSHTINSDHIGIRLAAARQAAGLSVSDLSVVTHLRPDYLSAIEALRVDDLPSIGYVLGFVRTYAKAVGLDDAQAVIDYKTAVAMPDNVIMRDRPHFVPKRDIKLPRGFISALTVTGFAAMLMTWYGVQTGTEAAVPELTSFATLAGEVETAPPIAADMVTIRMTAPSWVQVKNSADTILVSRIFVTGETWQGKAGGGYSLSVRDAAAIEIYIGENKRPPLGKTGEAKYDVVLSEH